jgi:hypothetical protein
MGITARLAPLGLIRKTFFSKKFLFTRGENEFLSAIPADDGFVLEHGKPLSVNYCTIKYYATDSH